MATKPPLPDAKLPLWRGGQPPETYYALYLAWLDGFLTGSNVPLTQGAADALYEALGQFAGINTQTASYVLVLGDKGKTVEMNVAGANTLTFPPHSSVAFPVKSYVNIVQVGAGQTTLTPGAGVTLRARIGLKLSGQWAMATAYQRATDEWVCGGALTP